MSVANLKARSKASRQKYKFEVFWREASLRSFILSKIKVDNKLVTLPAGVSWHTGDGEISFESNNHKFARRADYSNICLIAALPVDHVIREQLSINDLDIVIAAASRRVVLQNKVAEFKLNDLVLGSSNTPVAVKPVLIIVSWVGRRTWEATRVSIKLSSAASKWPDRLPPFSDKTVLCQSFSINSTYAAQFMRRTRF